MMNKLQKTYLILMFVGFLFFAIRTGDEPDFLRAADNQAPLSPAISHMGPGDAFRQKPYAAGELIIKFWDPSIVDRQEVISKSRLLSGTGPTTQSTPKSLPDFNSDRIDALNAAFGLRSVEVAIDHVPDVTAIQKRFPTRANRAPQDAMVPDMSNIYVFKFPEAADVEAVAREYAGDPAVEYAHANYALQLYSLPQDTFVDPDQDGVMSKGAWGQSEEDLWGWKQIHTDEIWETDQGEGVVVAVVDTGVDYTHADFYRDENGNGQLDPGEQYNIWVNPCEDINHNGFIEESDFDGVDNPCPGESLGNGFVDDIRGWDFYGECKNFVFNVCLDIYRFDNDPMDVYGHGTHVAGTIAAVANKAGIAGVAPKVKIMPVSFGGGNTFALNFAQGLMYASVNGADVINNSWGFQANESGVAVIEDAVTWAYGMGTVLVFAAGNDDEDASLSVPQRMTNPKPIVVSATAPDDRPTSFTSWGTVVDVAAPGGSAGATLKWNNILSLKSKQAKMVSSRDVVDVHYARMAGTSMSAPHVSGVVALILEQNPGLTPDEVRQILRKTADDVYEPGVDLKTGAGRVNARRAIAALNPRVMITAFPNSVFSKQKTTLNWTGENVLFCEAESSPANSNWSGPQSLSGSKEIVLSQSTTFKLSCQTILGASISKSASVQVSNGTPPEKPTGLQIVNYTFSRVDMKWQDNSDNESGFIVERSLFPLTSGWKEVATVGANGAHYSDTGLESGTEYYYRVKAYNDAGFAYSNQVNLKTLDGPKPDLSIAPPNWPATGEYGTIVPMSFEVKNIGQAVAAGFNNALYVNGQVGWSNWNWQQRQTNEAWIEPAKFTVDKCSDYKIYAMVDVPVEGQLIGNIQESDENNNRTAEHIFKVVPQKPGSLTFSSIGENEVTVNWGPSVCHANYYVYRDGMRQVISSPDQTSHRNEGLTCDRAYLFKVEAVNANGKSFVEANVRTRPCTEF